MDRIFTTLKWRHNKRHGVSNRRHIDCLLSRLFTRTSMKTWKLCVTVLCEGNPSVTGGFTSPLWWRHNGRDSVSNHQPHHCLINSLFRRRSKKTSKLGVTGLCVGNSPGTGEFPAQMASNAKNVSIWWRHHDKGPVTRKMFPYDDIIMKRTFPSYIMFTPAYVHLHARAIVKSTYAHVGHGDTNYHEPLTRIIQGALCCHHFCSENPVHRQWCHDPFAPTHRNFDRTYFWTMLCDINRNK